MEAVELPAKMVKRVKREPVLQNVLQDKAGAVVNALTHPAINLTVVAVETHVRLVKAV